MNTLEAKVSVKVVGLNGQISLGKEFAGRQVLVEEREPGVWLIRTAHVIPQNEVWLHQPKTRDDLAAALHWAQRHRPEESDPVTILDRIEHERKPKQKKRSARSKQ